MKAEDISFIIPVFNRPDEIRELLDSLTQMEVDKTFEVVIVEDGSTISSEGEISKFKDRLNISYYFKENSGPGDSRNYGMKLAKGSYFIILDSDCIIPPKYLQVVLEDLNNDYVDCFGGPDAAHESFSVLQKAINFSMTSFITTGGIRGRRSSVNEFEPRSFNMGLSKKGFEATDGFGLIHPGEDPDLSIRLKNKGFKTKLIPEAYVYHKRRISWRKFFKQVNKFGMVRPILNKWHPETRSITYWLPSLFVIFLIIGLVLAFFGTYELLMLYALYFIIGILLCWIKTGSLSVALLSPIAILIQFVGYGIGFLRSTIKLWSSNKSETELFPNLFFKA